MDPLDLRMRPPRSCYAELDGLMVMPRTIEKLRAFLPGGNPGPYFINGQITGISGYLLQRLGIAEADLLAAVRDAKDEGEIAQWLRQRVDATRYSAINQILRHIKPKHSQDPEYFRSLYAETMKLHPELEFVVDIIDADDRRMFASKASG
jgi:hypothetical protein